MDEETRIERAGAFGVNPVDYDAVRPGYPSAMFQRLYAYAGLESRSRVLEIGSGTGQATRSLVDSGAAITCLEPSAALCNVARENFSDRDNATIQQTRFEDFEPSTLYDLILAATSFHWIDPELRYCKCADLLQKRGTLAIASNTHPQPYTGFFEAVQACYARHVPEWGTRRQPDFSWDSGKTDSFAAELSAAPRFRDVEVHCFDWQADFTADQYGRLLNTFSDHIRLGPERLDALSTDIARLINERYGGVVHRPYRSMLRLARRC